MPNVLFLSRRNSLRSQLAEATLRKIGGSRFRVHSCGVPGSVQPVVSPIALATLQKAGIPIDDLHTKSWSEFVRLRNSKLDYVITLDDSIPLAHPVWPGQPELALWHYPDIDDVGAQIKVLAPQVTKMLLSMQHRLELLVQLCSRATVRREIRDDLRDLGRT